MITLVKSTYTMDEIGQQVETIATREVFAQVGSVYGAEWHRAGLNGIKPSYKFTMYDFEYNEEPTVIYEGIEYSVYRTYLSKNETIELYVEKKAGNNG